jgi:hypothetical protein
MIKKRGANMKRLIALLVATVFCVSLFCPPLAALDRDPTKPVPWMSNSKNPEGDEGGWDVPVEKQNELSILDLWISFLISHYVDGSYFKIIIVNKVESVDNNGNVHNAGTQTSRRANSE